MHSSPLLLAIVSGLLLSLIGIAYGMGRAHQLQSSHIATFMCLAGVPVFSILAGMDMLCAAPPRIWLLGLAAGLSQFVTMRAINAALRRGPLSPVWCAASMTFLPALLYAWVALGEHTSGMRLAGAVLACVCVVLGAVHGSRAKKGDGAGHAHGWRAVVAYSLLLLLIVPTAASLHVSNKILGSQLLPDGRNAMDAFGLVFFLACYGSTGLGLLGDSLVRNPPPRESRRALVWLGLLASIGSIGGFLVLRLAAASPAALVYPVNSVSSLLGVTLASVLIMRERITLAWAGMVAAGVIAVLLVGLS